MSSAGNLHLKWTNVETGVVVEFYGVASSEHCLHPQTLYDKELDVAGDLLDRLLHFFLQSSGKVTREYKSRDTV